MSRLRYLNPFRIRAAARGIREVTGGGGPAAIRLAGISRPQGWVVPTARINLEVIARDGTVTQFAPPLPVPFPYAWAYRLAHRLHVPLVSSVDPERLRLRLPIPGR